MCNDIVRVEFRRFITSNKSLKYSIQDCDCSGIAEAHPLQMPSE